jgi:hypothetical protein
MRETAAVARRSEDEPFFPSGAVASFAVMIVFYLGFWFAMYLLMAQRG